MGRSVQAAAEELAVFEALRRGDPVAFARLVELHHRDMLTLAAAYATGPEEARRHARHAWSVALGGLELFEWRCSFRAWLFGILAALGRSHGGQAHDGDEPPRDLPHLDAGDDWADLPWGARWSGIWDVAERGLGLLALDRREVLVLHDVLGWEDREVCDALGLTEARYRTLLADGRQRLADTLAAHLGRSQPPRGMACLGAAPDLLGIRRGWLPPDDRRLADAHLRRCGACGAAAARLERAGALVLGLRPPGVTAADPGLAAVFRKWKGTMRRARLRALLGRVGRPRAEPRRP